MHMNRILLVIFALIPACGFCSESATPITASAVSSTVSQGSCLVPGRTCNRADLTREVGFVNGEILRMETESGDLGSQIKRAGNPEKRKALESRRLGIQRRLQGFRKVGCRLRTMKDSMKGSSTVFVGPGR